MNYNIPPVMNIEKCPGFGFFPTDECLFDDYLSGKNSNQAKEYWPILEIDLCELEPYDLLGLPTAGCDSYMYFFNELQYADERNQSYKRRTKTGYWKSTSKPREIKGGGTKRYLVFYKKGPTRGSKEVRTGWKLQEYDNGGQYVIVRLQKKPDKTKKSKLKHQNVSTDDIAEENQIASHDSEVALSKLRHQNVSTDDIAEENQIASHDSEVVLSGFEDQNPQEMIVMADHDKGETTGLMALVCNKNSSSTEFGGQYESPSMSSNKLTVNHSAWQDNEVVPPHFVDQNWKNMTVTVSAYDTNKTNSQEDFSCATENQLSTNESEGECSPFITSPYNNFQNELTFNGEGMLFSPFNYSGLSRYNDPAATTIDGSDWWNNQIY